MAEGLKTGGRQKGTPNKKTRQLQSLIDGYGHNPVEALVSVAMDANVDPALRTKVNLELMQYLYPKRKAVELSGDPDNPIETKWQIEVVGAKNTDTG